VARLVRKLKRQKTALVALDTPRDPFAGSSWKEEFGIRTALWLPLVFQNRITGVALLYQPHVHREFTIDQLQLARNLGTQAAVAIRLSQAYEHERNIAVTLQRGLGPTVAAHLQN